MELPRSVSVVEFFTSPLYPMQLLYKVATLYGAYTMDIYWFSYMNTSPEENMSILIASCLWLCHIL